MEIWRLVLWAARCAAFRQASVAYREAGSRSLCKAAWFVANVLARRGPLVPDPHAAWSRFARFDK